MPADSEILPPINSLLPTDREMLPADPFVESPVSMLMAPRPFMVERGHDDGVGIDEWVAWEFAKVRRHYAKLGLAANTEIEFFDGPHTINGKGTFDFLQRHLKLPTPQVPTQKQ